MGTEILENSFRCGSCDGRVYLVHVEDLPNFDPAYQNLQPVHVCKRICKQCGLLDWTSSESLRDDDGCWNEIFLPDSQAPPLHLDCPSGSGERCKICGNPNLWPTS